MVFLSRVLLDVAAPPQVTETPAITEASKVTNNAGALPVIIVLAVAAAAVAAALILLILAARKQKK